MIDDFRMSHLIKKNSVFMIRQNEKMKMTGFFVFGQDQMAGI